MRLRDHVLGWLALGQPRAFGPADAADARHWEVLEGRRLRADWEFLVSVDVYDFVFDVGWSDLFGTMTVGDAVEHVPSLVAGSPQDQTVSYAEWDDGSAAGFDSGWQPFSLRADVQSGLVSVDVGDFPQLTHLSTESHDSVTEVIVVAEVRGPGMRMSWDELTVTIRNSVSLDGPQHYHGMVRADTFARSEPWAQQQQVLHLYVPGEGLNEVVVEGHVRFEARPGVDPTQSIFGRVLIRSA